MVSGERWVARTPVRYGSRRAGGMMRIARLRGLIAIVVMVGIGIAAFPSLGARVTKPNVLLIVGDDLGYGELSCQGNPQVPTPNIDTIARNGVRFTSGYVSCPYCSPTRAGLM